MKALEIRPTEKNVLLARSKCHLQLAEAQESLADAETALKNGPDEYKAVYRKAEALYSKGYHNN